MSKAKVELTAEVIRKAIEDGKFSSMTQLAHHLGYKGSVSSSLTRKFKLLVPEIVSLMEGNQPAKDAGKGTQKAANPTAPATKAAPKEKAEKTAKADKAVPKPAKIKGGKYPRDPRNVFRPGSNYGLVFDVLARFPTGIERAKLVQLVAAASGKDVVHAGYDCQVLLSAKKNEPGPGLNPYEGPRHRSCRPGFFCERTNGHVKLVVGKD